jgi:hypothetical protein
MHILIFAPTGGAAEEMQAALGDAAERYTVAVTWLDVLSSLEEDAPDLILIERAALARLEPTTLLNLTEPGRWPPLIFVDTPDGGARDGVLLTKRLAQAAVPSYQIGELRIDTRKKRVGLGACWVRLPPLQYRLLLTLAKRTGEVVSYRELLRAVGDTMETTTKPVNCSRFTFARSVGAWDWTPRNVPTSARYAASATCSPPPKRIEQRSGLCQNAARPSPRRSTPLRQPFCAAGGRTQGE